ncbi:hypothetical protein ACFC26_07755 [Kitasatospora purpeofusca]|uniref:hypothetical protein n=1 Tax=Kitasatospora purpeofusca TaxID=67352 RepID=UPI0035E23077
MSIRVKRATGRVVLAVDTESGRIELTPAEARAVARRLTDAARDVEGQRQTSGEGWEMEPLHI